MQLYLPPDMMSKVRVVRGSNGVLLDKEYYKKIIKLRATRAYYSCAAYYLIYESSAL